MIWKKTTTPSLTCDSDDSDFEDESQNIKSKQVSKFKIGQKAKSSFQCPVVGCPKALSKPWKNAASLHGHLADHCVGKFQGTIPFEYFDHWNKEFCSKCCQMRLPFSPSQSCSCCSRKSHSSITQPAQESTPCLKPFSYIHSSDSKLINSPPLSCPANVSLPSME